MFFSILIVNDGILEEMESFAVGLIVLREDLNVLLPPAVLVEIEDDDQLRG